MTRVTSPEGATLRLFAAVEPDATARETLDALQGDWLRAIGIVAGVRPLPSESLHLTLRFFGSTAASRVESLAKGLQSLAAQATPCTVHLQGLEYWPPRAPRVVVAVFDAPPALPALASAIEHLAQQLGFPPEPRPFRAHVTLARSNGVPLPAYVAPLPQLTMPACNMSLMQSRTHSTGAQYEALDRFALGAPAR